MDVIMPQLGETVSEGTVSAWHKKVGETVSPREPLFDVSSDKVEMEVPAPADGTLLEIRVTAGATVPVGEVIAVIGRPGEMPGETATPVPAPDAAPALPPVTARTAAAVRASSRDANGNPLSPAVRRLVAEHGLDPARIAGSGAGGRIKKKDVLAHLNGAGAATACPPVSDDGVETIPFSNLRKRTAEHMVRSKATSPHVLQAVEADFARVARSRAGVAEAWTEREGFSLTYLPFVAWAVCEAIRDFPRVNAMVDGESLVVFRRVHLAVAVDLDLDGLVAPVIRDAHRMSLRELARAIRDVSERARSGRLVPEEYQGGTYTISNSGVFGTMITAPVINQPQVAILSTDGVAKKPVVIESEDGDAIAIRPVGVLAQSFDHRAIDGAYSAAFLARLREIIQTKDWQAALT